MPASNGRAIRLTMTFCDRSCRGRRGTALKASVSSNVVFPARLGTPREVASVVVELITNDYINADVIRVDGGIRMPPR